jgi:hypothetical protein
MNENITSTKTLTGNVFMGLFLTLFIGGVAFYLFFSAYIEWREYNDSSDWDKTQGTITYVGVQKIDDGNNRVFFAPDIRYAYVVNGKDYEGERISFDDRGYAEEENAQEAAEDYTLGQEVTVLYKSSQPDRAVLERTTNWSAITIYMVAGGALFILVIIIARGTFLASRASSELEIQTPLSNNTQSAV